MIDFRQFVENLLQRQTIVVLSPKRTLLSVNNGCGVHTHESQWPSETISMFTRPRVISKLLQSSLHWAALARVLPITLLHLFMGGRMGGCVDGKGELYKRQSVAVLNTIMLLTVPIAGTIQCKDMQYSVETCNSVPKYAIQCKYMHMQYSAKICNSVVCLLIILLQLFWERKGGGETINCSSHRFLPLRKLLRKPFNLNSSTAFLRR